MHELLSKIAQTWGLAFFVLMFLGALVYALWPANRETFRKAAETPLHDKEPGDA